LSVFSYFRKPADLMVKDLIQDVEKATDAPARIKEHLTEPARGYSQDWMVTGNAFPAQQFMMTSTSMYMPVTATMMTSVNWR
jgi:hypothetical protein